MNRLALRAVEADGDAGDADLGGDAVLVLAADGDDDFAHGREPTLGRGEWPARGIRCRL